MVSFLGESSVKRTRAKQEPGDTSYRTLTGLKSVHTVVIITTKL